ncbi:MAG: hypothetical protein HGA47_04185 [Zoogloea sp.]|nr:hypothetical protein [Zoogloea sp.]
MDVTHLDAQAMKHWERWLPQKTADLKEAGTFEFRANQAAERALAEINLLVSKNVSREQAEEMVLPEYIFLPPERGVK